MLSDVRFTLRWLRRSPGLTALVLSTLALAIGASVASFAVVDKVLRPLPMRDPAGVVVIWPRERATPTTIGEVSYATFRSWQQQARGFEQLAAMGSTTWGLVLQEGEPATVPVAAVSASFFPLAGTPAAIGRTLQQQDDRLGSPRMAVLSHGSWQRRFGSDPAIVGRPLRFRDGVYTVEFAGIGTDGSVLIEGQRADVEFRDWEKNPRVNLESVTPGYFEAIGMPVVRGRGVAAADTLDAPRVAVVGEALARRLWPGQDPIGKRLNASGAPADVKEPWRWATVVGVVRDGRYRGLTDPRFDLYLADAQSDLRVKHVMVRAAVADPLVLAGAIRAEARRLDRSVLVEDAGVGRSDRAAVRGASIRRVDVGGDCAAAPGRQCQCAVPAGVARGPHRAGSVIEAALARCGSV